MMALALANNVTFKSADDGSTPATISDLVSVELSCDTEMFSVVTKDSARNNEVLPGLQTCTLSVSGIADTANGENVDNLVTAFLAGTKQDWAFVDGSSDLFTGEGYWNSFSTSSATNDKVEFSGSMTTTGAITNAIA